MSPIEETTTKQRKHTRPIFWVLLGLVIVVLVVAVFPKLGSAVGQYRSAKKEEMAAVDRSVKATGDKIKTIKEMGLSEYARRTSTKASDQDSVDSRDDSSGSLQPSEDAVLEQKIRQELENSAARQNLGWHCTRVRLAQCDANTYLGLAEFDSAVGQYRSAKKAKPLAFELKTDGSNQSFGFCKLLNRADWEKEYQNVRKNKPGIANDAEKTGGYSHTTLELQSWRWYTTNGFVLAEGAVKNVGKEKLASVEVVVMFMDASGDLVTSADALIKYDPILPDQVSPFTVMATANPAITQASIDFKEFMGDSVKWKVRDSMAEPNAVKQESIAGTPVWKGRIGRQTPLNDDDIKKLRRCQIGYVNDVGLAAAGISFGEFIDRLSRSQTSPPVLTQSTDGQTVVTIKEGTKALRLLFTCDPTAGACVIAGGEIDGQEIASDAALAIMLGLTAQ